MNFTVAFLIAMLHIFLVEGGYVASLKDKAGETKYGITKRTYPRENIKHLTKRRAGELYHRDFWTPIRADEMSCPMALTVFDSSVNMGKFRAIKMTQHIVGLPESGVVTDKMLKTLKMKEQTWAFKEYNKHRIEFYKECRQYKLYGKGWVRRIPRSSQCDDTTITEKDVFG